MPKPLSKDERELARKAKLCARHRAKGKLHYEEADRLLDELLKSVDVTKEFRSTRAGKRMFRFKDNFADSNTAFRAHGIKRYEIEFFERAAKP